MMCCCVKSFVVLVLMIQMTNLRFKYIYSGLLLRHIIQIFIGILESAFDPT